MRGVERARVLEVRARLVGSPEALRAQPQMQRFIAWVRTKPPGFYERVSRSDRIRPR